MDELEKVNRLASIKDAQSHCLSENTKNQYERRIKNFKLWCKDNLPDIVCSSDNILFGKEGLLLDQITKDNLLIYIDFVSNVSSTKFRKNKKAPLIVNGVEKKRPVTIDGIRNGLIFLFTRNHLLPPVGFRDEMSSLIKGYNNIQSEMKSRGEEDSTQGKDVLLFQAYNTLAGIAFKNNIGFDYINT